MLVGWQRVGRLRASGAGGVWATEVGGVGIQSRKGTCSCAIVGGVGGAVGRVDAQAGVLLWSSTVLGEQLCPSFLVSRSGRGESVLHRRTT